MNSRAETFVLKSTYINHSLSAISAKRYGYNRQRRRAIISPWIALINHRRIRILSPLWYPIGPNRARAHLGGAARWKFISYPLGEHTDAHRRIYRFSGSSIPQMIMSAARTRDGIRSARINKFAKALLRYVAQEVYGALSVSMLCPAESRLFIRSIRVRSWRFLCTFGETLPREKHPAARGARYTPGDTLRKIRNKYLFYVYGASRHQILLTDPDRCPNIL